MWSIAKSFFGHLLMLGYASSEFDASITFQTSCDWSNKRLVLQSAPTHLESNDVLKQQLLQNNRSSHVWRMLHTCYTNKHEGARGRTPSFSFSFIWFDSFIVKLASWLRGTICLCEAFHIILKSHVGTGVHGTGGTPDYWPLRQRQV